MVPRDRIHAGSGLILRTPTQRAVRDPVAVARRCASTPTAPSSRRPEITGTGSSAPPTPSGTSTWPTPPPAGPTSTTCSTRSTRCCARRSPTTTSRASTPACGPCWRASPTTTRALSREHAVTQHVPGPHLGGRRQVHDLPGDGPRRHRHGGPQPRPAGAAVLHRAGAAARRGRATTRCGTGATGWPRTPSSTWPASSTCSAATARQIDAAARPDRATGPTSASPSAHGGPYLGAEVVFAATHEAALHLDDVLTRRTRLSIETFHRGVDCAAGGGPADGRTCSGGTTQPVQRRGRRATGSGWRRSVDSQTRPDDRTADAVRMGAPEPRHLVSLAGPARPTAPQLSRAESGQRAPAQPPPAPRCRRPPASASRACTTACGV